MRFIKSILLILSVFMNAYSQEPLFEESFSLLNDMLTGKEKYSFKKAVLSTEEAFLDGNLDTVEVNRQLKILHTLSSGLIKERFLYYPERDKEIVNKWASVFQVMCDTIPIRFDDKEYKYLPFQYDFDDIFGHSDPQKLFVSKLVLSRKGNCHSLPYLYKILAEQLGAEAYLALAPNHIYIKIKSIKDGWYNTELTSGIFPNDSWLMASGFIHIDAVKNGMYLKALNDNESIALLLLDLAEYYQYRFPDNDGQFIMKCCQKALELYPNFAKGLILKVETLKKQRIDIKELAKVYEHIHDLGYRNMPESMYLSWLISLKEERSKFENTKLYNLNKK